MSEQQTMQQWRLADLATASDLTVGFAMSRSATLRWEGIDDFPPPILERDLGKLYSYRQVRAWFRQRMNDLPQFRGAMLRHHGRADTTLPGPNPVVADRGRDWDLDDLVGIGELMEELIKSRPAVRYLYEQRQRNGFPEPVLDTLRGPLFSRQQVRSWWQASNTAAAATPAEPDRR